MKYPRIKFGPFPHKMVEKTLNLELEPGGLYLSAQAHKHIAEDHPTDYPIVGINLDNCVNNPNYIGQSPRHQRNIEFVKRLPVRDKLYDGTERIITYIALVAVSVERDQYGDYRIVSGYLIEEKDITTRRASGYLSLAKK